MTTLIEAVPGAGKTARIVREVTADVASGIKKIGVTTFSTAAAEELRSRITSPRVTIATISSLAGTILRPPKSQQGTLSYAQTLLAAAQKLSKTHKKVFDRLYIDEAQDIGYHQYVFLKELVAHCTDVIIVGDPLQSIYEFGGSNANHMRLLANGGLFERMSTSYRLPREIAEFVSSVFRTEIQSLSEQNGGVYLTTDPEEDVRTLLDTDGSVALIVRTNREVEHYVEVFESEGIRANYTVSGFTLPIAITVSKILLSTVGVPWSVLRTVVASSSVVSWRALSNIDYAFSKTGGIVTDELLRRISTEIAPRVTSEERTALMAAKRMLDEIELPIKASRVEDVVAHIYPQALEAALLPRSERDSDAMAACVEYLETGAYPVVRVNRRGKLTVMTAHVSKGTEFDHVVVDASRFDRFDDINVLYVALTRARNTLHVHIPPHVPIRDKWNLFDAIMCEFGHI